MADKRNDRFESFAAMGQAMGHQPPRQNPPTQRRGPSGGPTRGGGSQRDWREGYLSQGYFDTSEGGNPYLRVDLVTTTAQEIAQALGRRMKSAQLRQFYNYVRNLERRLRGGTEFQLLVPEIAKLKGAAQNRVTRGVAPFEFAAFIDRNVDQSVKGARDFRDGFVPHFQAVVAYLPRERR
jgi:CRISPR type III-A-associated protein Csm2